MTIKRVFDSLLISLLISNLAYATSVKFVGTAYEIDTDNVLYTEHHDLIVGWDGAIERSSVKYYSPVNKLIAEKTLVYSDLRTMPELEFIDHRTKTQYQTSNIRHKSEINVLLQYLNTEGSGKKVLSIGSKKPSVTDAGFEELVAASWQILASSEKVDFQFLALSRAEYFNFQLSKISSDDELLVLKLEPSSWLISLLMEPIFLTYETKSRRLVKFEGLTNIEEVKEGIITGKNYSARIEYTYFSEELVTGAKL